MGSRKLRAQVIKGELRSLRGNSRIGGWSFLSFVHVKHYFLHLSSFPNLRRSKERAGRRTIKLNSIVPQEFHDESNRNLRFLLEIKIKKRERENEGGGRKRKRENVERTRRSSTWPLEADKPAATRSISRKRDGELYRSIRLPASTRLRIQLPLSAGAIYRETNGRCFFRRTLTSCGK